jgi:hypothetical protein
MNYEEWARTVTVFEVAIARLVDSTRAISEFDRYLKQAGFVVVSGHPLDGPEQAPAG